MPRGYAPQPSAIKAMRGWPGKRKSDGHKGVEPMPEHGAPECPDHIKDDALAYAEWEDTCKHLASMNVLHVTDRTVLEVYCKAYSDWRRNTKLVAERGDLYKNTKGNIVTAPWVLVRDRAYKQLKDMLIELGLTPAARARMRVPIKEVSSGGKWSGMINAA